METYGNGIKLQHLIEKPDLKTLYYNTKTRWSAQHVWKCNETDFKTRTI